MPSQSPYIDSPFRILGLPASATPETIASTSTQLLTWAEQGEFEKVYASVERGDLPWLAPLRPTVEAIARATEQLQSLEARLEARAFWYHLTCESDAEALQQLTSGHPEKALAIWNKQRRQPGAPMIFAAHNLAVFFHSRSWEAPRGSHLCAEDMRESVRWWGHIIDGMQLAPIIANGETWTVKTGHMRTEIKGVDNPDEVRQVVDKVIKALRGDISEQLSYGRFRACFSDGGASEASGLIPLLHGRAAFFGFNSKDYYNRKAELHIALEQASEAARLYRFEEMDAAFEKADRLSASSGDAETVKVIRDRLYLSKVLRGLITKFTVPPLARRVGTGSCLVMVRDFDADTRSFSARLLITMCWLPVWMPGCYRVRQDNHGQWVFLGKVPSDPIGWIFNLFAVVFLLLLTLSTWIF